MGLALVVTHSRSEDVGRLGPWLVEEGLSLELCEPWSGAALPSSLAGYDALVVMGGPQQAYDDTSAPWLSGVKELLRAAVAASLPTLGVCLGGQLLAEACGGAVRPGMAGPEVGARLLTKRDLAAGDPIMWDLPLSPVVVEWHFDEIAELPPGAVLLASSTSYPHQAFRLGDRAWGLQFHLEPGPEMVSRWAGRNREELASLGIDSDAVLARTLPELDEVSEVWGEVIRRFARLAA